VTEGGQRLLESAQRILRDVERAGDEIRAHKAHPSGKIVLAVTPTLCPVVVPELFAQMRRHYPMIELKVVSRRDGSARRRARRSGAAVLASSLRSAV
jgi:LysR family nitrogen assimilation transcriptional regulator